jgi:hypothetical protein
VVAHLITVAADIPEGDVEALGRFWGATFGVPAVIIKAGVEVIGSVLADGQLQELPLAPELAVKVQEVLVTRQALRRTANGDGH